MGKLAKTRFATLREFISEWWDDRVKVADALCEIHDQKLYLEEYDSFEECCHDVFGMKRAAAYRLMDLSRVQKTLTAGVPVSEMWTPKLNETQARVLLPVPISKRSEVYHKAEEKGPVTGRALEAAAREIVPEIFEELDAEVPAQSIECGECVRLLAENEELRAVVAELKEDVIAALNQGEIPLDDPVDEDVDGEPEDKMDALRRIVAGDIPGRHAAAESVKNATCRHCGRRFHSASRFAMVCPNCAEGGHINVPTDCRACISEHVA